MTARLRNCGSVAIGLIAFIATSAVIHSFLPPMVPKGVAAKLKYFTEHKDEFDTVIVGTSQLYYSVSPKIFDATTRENGMPTRTFNFGIDAMHPPENFYVLDQILKTKPKKLKWVLLELGEVRARWFKILGTQRAVYWHDWPRTEMTVKKALDPRGDAKWYIQITRLWLARRDLAWNLGLFAKQFANVGRVADLLPAAEQERFADSAVELGPAGDGYRIAGEAMSAERAVSYQQWLAREISQARPKPLDRVTDQGYHEAAGHIRAAGAKSIFVVTPMIFQSPLQFRQSSPSPIIAFNDAGRFPEYYDSKARVDESHLVREAAEKFTIALAREFVRQAAQP
ncbi:MAG: hypothetical protein DME70_03305 [Verrucomicrobia bacterium]|nr:MAG: hypothetical protein DME70_03305 [Verrucomicrobiota bacterium]